MTTDVRRTVPIGARATCRVQLRGGVDFASVADRLDYWRSLGITHLYLSPIFTAATGSTHGYDVVDPNEIDPVLGGEDGFRDLCTRMRAAGLGLLLDIVPNHLGIGAGNAAWQGLLREGAAADQARWFDVDWQAIAGGTPGKLLLPILDRPWREALAEGLITIDREAGVARVFDHILPLAADSAEGPLMDVLERQHWRLAHWRVGNRLLNWRRFFDITTLAGLRQHDPAVFDATHRKLLELFDIDVLQGLRIDHVDGMADPGAYLRRLDNAWRERRADEPWIVVEKILAPNEALPDSWPVAGTTGYETMSRITAVFVDKAGLVPMQSLWRACGGQSGAFEHTLATAKREILSNQLRAELERLTMRLVAAPILDADPADVREALIRLIVATDRYRAYGDEQPLAFEAAWSRADFKDLPAGLPPSLLAAMPAGGWARTAFEQLSAPAMAKAMEDTAFYRYTPALVLNEVGSEPGRPPLDVKALHQAFGDRALTRPGALVATATHDTKRGEDARARLALITHAHADWPNEFAAWMHLATRHRFAAEPDECTLVFLMQSLLGAWPQPGENDVELDDFRARVDGFVVKALREAKRRTSWLEPDVEYERLVIDFMHALLGDDQFRTRVTQYLLSHARGCREISLAQLTLKLTLPGVADIYDGTERFDFSMVDPDNRRPIDAQGLRSERDARSGEHHRRRAKQTLIRRLLQARRAMPSLFAHGAYQPVSGLRENLPVFAFTRHIEGAAMAVAVVDRYQDPAARRALLTGAVIDPPPEDCGAGWRPVHEPEARPAASIDLAEWLADAPVAVFVAGEEAAH
ncbi:MAG: malto-oligosyltrehalose synthase [Burkholderiaceae bacterium]